MAELGCNHRWALMQRLLFLATDALDMVPVCELTPIDACINTKSGRIPMSTVGSDIPMGYLHTGDTMTSIKTWRTLPLTDIKDLPVIAKEKIMV